MRLQTYLQLDEDAKYIMEGLETLNAPLRNVAKVAFKLYRDTDDQQGFDKETLRISEIIRKISHLIQKNKSMDNSELLTLAKGAVNDILLPKQNTNTVSSSDKSTERLHSRQLAKVINRNIVPFLVQAKNSDIVSNVIDKWINVSKRFDLESPTSNKLKQQDVKYSRRRRDTDTVNKTYKNLDNAIEK